MKSQSNMKLSPEQIDQLYLFTRQHYVEYYDLQTELVDHLANAIEQQWQENPKISFEDALQVEFKKFGIFGFTDVVEKRRKALSKKYFKLIWGHLKAFFKLPRIILTFVMIGVVAFLLRNINIQVEVFYTLYVCSMFYAYFNLLSIFRKRNKDKKENTRRWLFKEMLFDLEKPTFLIIIPFQLMSNIDNLNQLLIHPLYSLLISSFLVIYGLFLYIVQNVIPSKAEQYLKETYPEYEISK